MLSSRIRQNSETLRLNEDRKILELRLFQKISASTTSLSKNSYKRYQHFSHCNAGDFNFTNYIGDDILLPFVTIHILTAEQESEILCFDSEMMYRIDIPWFANMVTKQLEK